MVDQEKTKGTLVTWKGEFTYEYFRYFNKTYKINTYAFMIWDENQPEKEKADFSLLIMADGLHLKVIDLFTNDYRGRGIAPAIILEAQKIFGKRIISSSNTHKSFTGEANWPEAIERIWEPLTQQGLAVYDQVHGHYILLDRGAPKAQSLTGLC